MRQPADSRAFLHRILRSNFAARWCMTSTDILIPSTGWSCQIFCTGFCSSVMMLSSLLKLAGQHVLDAVNFGGDVSRRQSGDLSDRSGIESFEVGEDYVAIERLQTLNEAEESVERVAAVGGMLAAVRIRKILQFFQAEQCLWPGAALVEYMRCAYVVSDAVDPGAKRASPVEAVEAAP